jgi:hypothetical protein
MWYYWENRLGMMPSCGTVFASSDEEAAKKIPDTAICLYRESDTSDGLPFVVLFRTPSDEYGKEG